MSRQAAWAEKARAIADRIRKAVKYEDAKDLAVKILSERK